MRLGICRPPKANIVDIFERGLLYAHLCFTEALQRKTHNRLRYINVTVGHVGKTVASL